MIKLKIHGKLPSKLTVPPLIVQIKGILDNSPEDEVFATQEFCEIANCSDVIQTSRYNKHPILEGYSHKIEQVRYWGNPKAILELKRQTKP
jgi:hypothetical protein